MKTRLAPLLALTAVSAMLLSSGCKEDESKADEANGSTTETEGVASSCDLTADSMYCLDFGPDAPKNIAQKNCDGAKQAGFENGVAKVGAACPTANRVGSCAATITGVAVTYRYYSPKSTAEAAQENCKGLSGTGGAGGTFTAN
jgi:hypothetical protein